MAQRTLFKQPNFASSSSKATSLIRRQETVFRKARELSILCGILVCVIYYGSDGELKTWPEDRKKVKAMAQRYWSLSETQRRKRSVTLHEFREKIDKDDSGKKKKKKVIRVPKVWDPRFDNYSVEQLTGLIQSLERALVRIQRRIHAVVEGQKQREIQNMNMGNQEFMMPTTMNHLHQKSNHVSEVPFNHVNGNISQIPVPASALDQWQSLAPFPPELMIYPNSDVGNYSGSLGVQVTGINGFQNMNTNVYSCNNFNVEDYNNNFNVEDYNNNYSVNANSLSHQFVPYPAQQHYNNIYSVNANSLTHQLVQYPTQHHHYNNTYTVKTNSTLHQFVQYPTQEQHWTLNRISLETKFRSLYLA